VKTEYDWIIKLLHEDPHGWTVVDAESIEHRGSGIRVIKTMRCGWVAVRTRDPGYWEERRLARAIEFMRERLMSVRVYRYTDRAVRAGLTHQLPESK